MNGFWNYWNSLSPTLREGILAGIISTLAITVIGGVLKLSGISIRALFRRLVSPPVVPPLSPPIPQIIVNVPPPTLLPPTERPQITETISFTPLIPKSPPVGFVARRDKDGRDILELLKEDLAPERNQLIALWGEGGIGKTTLAAEAARALSADYKPRVIWASAEKRAEFTFSTFLDEIATGLNRTDILRLAIEPKVTEVQLLIASGPTLIVLDNFETIPKNERQRCIEFLKNQSPHSALITTREMVDGARNILIDAMSSEEAKEFLERLIKQSPEPNIFAGLAEQIVQTAAANPLAMEWIVAQINLAQKPADVLDDLAEGEGDAAQRVFDRSFNLPQLGNDGRAALLALSLFVPSASRAALAEVAAFGADEKRLNEAVKRLAALRLVGTADGGKRLMIQGLTRELAKSHLKKDDRAAEFHRRFVAHFLSYAESNSQPTAEDFDAVEAERDNILSAMDMAFILEDWISVELLMNAISFDGVNGYLTVRGYWDDAVKRGEQALEAVRNLGDERNIARFGHNLAIIYVYRGDTAQARRLYHESLDIEKRLGNQGGIAITLHQLALLAQDQGELEEAQQLYNESLDIEKRLGNQSGIAITLHQLAMLVGDQGELDEARQLYIESLEIAKELGDQRGIARTLHQLAILAQNQGELEEAQQLYNESLEITSELGDQSGIANSLHQLASLAEDQGDLDKARRLYSESLEINKKLGNQGGIAGALHQLASLAQDEGELDEARQLYIESLEISKKLGNQSSIASSLGQLGTLAEDEGNIAEAMRLFGEALTIFEKLKSPYAEITRRSLARVRGDDNNPSE